MVFLICLLIEKIYPQPSPHLIPHLSLIRSAPAGVSSCHVTRSGTGCRYALSLRPLGGAACDRHDNVTSPDDDDGDVASARLDDVVARLSRALYAMHGNVTSSEDGDVTDDVV